MKKTLLALCGVVVALTGCKKEEVHQAKPASPPAEAQAPIKEKVTINLSCGSVGKEFEQCKKGAEEWAKKTGHEVKFISTPTSTTEMLALYQQLLAAGASDVDIFQVDVIWPGILGEFFVDLKQYSKGIEKEHFPAIIENNTRGGRLVAMPLFTDAGMLFYRKDLLEKHKVEVPTTWEELTAAAKKIQAAERKAGQKDLWGFVWQGKAYEGLTCNALEWVASYNGGTIVNDKGEISINNPQAKAAVTMAASWVGTISPKGVLSYEEEDARGVFQSGNAVFMRNWPYAWALSQSDDSPVKGKVGVAALPKGGAEGRNAAALGGWQLAVSKFSKHPAEAADLVMHLTGPEEQKRHAIEASQHPTIMSVYKDPEVLAANPFFGNLVDTFTSAVPRPSTVTSGKYNQVSSEFWNAVHAVLSGQKKADASLSELETSLKGLSNSGNW